MWSLSLPLEKDVLRDALQFEPVSDWARGHFKQFKELSDAVKTHWEKSPTPRPEGRGASLGGQVGPWRVAEVHGHRLFLEPASPRNRGGAEAKPKRMEAHKSPSFSLRILLIKLQVWVSRSRGRRSRWSSSFSLGLVARCAVWARSLKWIRLELR